MARPTRKVPGVLTTFEVAKLCNANVNSIKNWIFQGKLKAYKTPGGHHRIEERHLRQFLKAHGMPDPFEPELKRVLVVDDNQITRESMQLVLSKTFECEAVADGYEALLRIGQDPPAVVLLDVYMPGLDGLEVIQRLREAEFLSKTHVVAYSGAAEEGLEERALAAGAHAFWHKSAELTEVLDAIRGLMQANGDRKGG